jgi:hypothetical protein
MSHHFRGSSFTLLSLVSYPVHALPSKVVTIDVTVDEIVERPRRVPGDMLGTRNRSKLSIVDLNK